MSQSEKLFAGEILQQLGGNRFITMTGAKNFMCDPAKKTVYMQIMRNKSKGNYLKITLNSMDLYDMQFSKIVNCKNIIVAERKGLYNDMLESTFKDVTGLNTRLF